MKKKLLTLFVREVAASLEKEGHYGTAHVYRSTANSFEKYIAGECACSGNRIRCEKREVTMYSLSPGLLKRYEEWLRLRGLSWDTVGTAYASGNVQPRSGGGHCSLRSAPVHGCVYRKSFRT